MIIAIHQPNYLPWLGYFAKIARADVFVFLDDVQYSKGSYTNRVQIARGGAPVWLTLPVQHEFGAAISDMAIARADWSRAHRDILRQAYGRAEFFKQVWQELELWLDKATGGLAAVNAGLIEVIARRLGLAARFVTSSALGIAADDADVRLAAIAARLAPGGTYLSGAGGAKYQAETIFSAKGITLSYSTFKPEPYPRSGDPFIPGLSIVDALFHLGFDGTAALVRPQQT